MARIYEENEKKINQSIEETLEKIGENKMKKASEKQGETSKSIDELAESMKKLSKGSGDKPEEDMESLRVLLEQLITFSLVNLSLKSIFTMNLPDTEIITSE